MRRLFHILLTLILLLAATEVQAQGIVLPTTRHHKANTTGCVTLAELRAAKKTASPAKKAVRKKATPTKKSVPNRTRTVRTVAKRRPTVRQYQPEETYNYEEETTEEPETDNGDKNVYDVVDQMPSFPGGNGALMTYLSSNVKYPVVAQENGVQGRVVVSFVVEKDGSITDVQVVRSVDPSLDREATRVVRSMPRWCPGILEGFPVRVKYNVPVSFRLQ